MDRAAVVALARHRAQEVSAPSSPTTRRGRSANGIAAGGEQVERRPVGGGVDAERAEDRAAPCRRCGRAEAGRHRRARGAGDHDGAAGARPARSPGANAAGRLGGDVDDDVGEPAGRRRAAPRPGRRSATSTARSAPNVGGQREALGVARAAAGDHHEAGARPPWPRPRADSPRTPGPSTATTSPGPSGHGDAPSGSRRRAG